MVYSADIMCLETLNSIKAALRQKRVREMRKTKIICTLGPSTDRDGVLRGMMLAGMNVARFNFSHGDHESHLKRLNAVKALREELGLPIATMLDTKGPEIRLKKFEGGFALVASGDLFTLTTLERAGDSAGCSISYMNLPEDVQPGTLLLIDDGLIAMRVEKVEGPNIVCRVENGGKLKDNKSVNIPGIHLSMPYISRQDEADILFGIEHGFDFIACSFVRSAQDVLEIRHILDSKKCDTMRVISKIENAEGVENIAEILSVSDGIMIARGDMGVEIDFTQIPAIQKTLITECYNSGKPAITATQMLESMIENPRPTRAETTDVANAIYDGTSAIMLSGETAAGKYPVEAVRTMAAIALQTEGNIDYEQLFYHRETSRHLNVADAVSHAACSTALDINATAIIAASKSGETARLISKYRPAYPIVACVTAPFVQRQLALSWGVTPLLMQEVTSTDELFEASQQAAKKAGLVQDGDLVVTTAGVPIGVAGTTNLVKADVVGDAILIGVGIGKTPAVGRVCVCANAAEVAEKFRSGDVLVVPSTSNALVDYMRNASAVIAEEGGLNSHAAVVGLTLKKPVIVGATGATKKLRHASRVAVDPERGIVRLATT